MMGLATLFAWTSAIAGLYISYYLDVAAGAAVASATVALYLIAALAGALRGT
jgi:ABC-type Mn2+/Zn2+ transport system permease subunit